MNDSVFHEGERLVQERTGEREIALLNGRMLHTGESIDSRLNVILSDIDSDKKLLVFKDTRTGATMTRHY